MALPLGAVFGMGLGLALLSQNWVDWGLYMMTLVVFHSWEFFYVALFHPAELSTNSFLLNHSREYGAAAIFSWVEYFVEGYFFPNMKGSWFFVTIGLVGIIVGQGLRTLAMWTAGSNFHHLVREEKDKAQTLVTVGIYNYLRHPSYFGWYYWCIATQILLTNPLATVAYAVAAWMFFNERIKDEEETLIRFFGKDYERYKAKTITGIPLIP
eukprot:TRINITY_DN11013_c0_g1_i1.p1 TRINITY_DN11013_c0_g1~~TRINITY_DN11013_c0_g1_i1.p1  ORF type:complete len:241 (-),score=52.36 TRINITY_DN11013_c0_g1_i1:183-815(-)